MRTFWSVKGGSGVTVTAAAVALRSAAAGVPTVLVDLCGDQAAALGMPEPAGPGLAEWCGTDERDPAALQRLFVPVTTNLSLLPRGRAVLEEGALSEVVAALARTELEPVVDAGLLPARGGREGGHPRDVVPGRSYLVLRTCYLAARRFVTSELRADGLVVVQEPGRALDAADLAAVTGVPLVAEVHVDPVVARAVDAGTLARRQPRPLQRALRNFR